MAKESRAKSAMGGKKKSSKKSGKKVHRMHIRRTANGGYIAQHENDPKEPTAANDEYHLNDINELKDHIAEHMGQEEEPGAAQAEASQPVAE